MDSFGAQLKHERERRDVELDEIARETKIRVRYLQALEEGDHSRLPGIVFAKGYVRAYAETIGANADLLVRAYVDEQRELGRLETEASSEQVLEALAAAVEHDREDSGRLKRLALIVVTVLVFGGAALGFMLLRNRGDKPAVVEQPSAVAEPIEVVEQPAPVETTPVDDSLKSNTEPSVQPPHVAREPLTPQPSANSVALTIPEFGVGTAVVDRNLSGRAASFNAGTRAVFWTRVLGATVDRTVRHVWSHEGNVMGAVELPVRAAHWRTYSRHTLHQTGNWTVEALDENGVVLAQESFVVTEPTAASASL